MNVLLSIKPEFADKIFNGQKKFEFRKNIFKKEGVTKVIVYATLPVGKVIGEFSIDSIIEGRPDTVWRRTSAHAGITKRFFSEYFDGREKAFAIKVGEANLYEHPLSLADLGSGISAPQSYRYL
ncbi:ASCH domain-containing protein [Pseudomonas sp. SWRI100]|uniref:ASCH domain-containing protein n=1 Tax=Pseudomonas TaxID=286 RepID=UPI001643FF34|nr:MULTISPECIES: ASCH domain-containing protein [Pseudomonas]MBC3495385.1 ASCH domain-containing protein [Pseudomonas sp. SWRI67]MBV4527143.1 ASCH domain-containing protein [Pseudomonas kermanshahensis]